MLRFLALAACLLLGPASANFGIFQVAKNNAPAASATWQTMMVGAGGYIRGIDIECDAGVGACNNSNTTTKVGRTDTYGAYVWITSGSCQGANVTAPCWQQVITSTSLPSGDPSNFFQVCVNATQSNCGVYEIRIAPSNTNIAYMEWNGYVYKTTNLQTAKSGGQLLWTATGFAQDTGSNPNDSYGAFGPKIAIDPQNPNNVIVCTETIGCFHSTNGGTSFTAITGLTNATTVGMIVVFDPSSSVSGGFQQGIYISSNGTGVYHSTNGGSSWTLTSGTPTTHTYMTITSAGLLYFADGTTFNLHEYNGSAWSSASTGSTGSCVGLTGVAVDSNNLTHIAVGCNDGELSYSSAGLTGTWSNFSDAGGANMTRTAGVNDPPWLGWTNEVYMTAGQIVYDPAQSNILYFSEGIGVWYTTVSSAVGTSIAWTSLSRGIEQLIGNGVISPPQLSPNCQAVTIEGDRPTFCISNPNAYPSYHGAVHALTDPIVYGWGIAWATGSPSTVIISADFDDNGSGYNTSGGQNNSGGNEWTAFGAFPSGNPGTYPGGSLAAGSSSVFIWALTAGGQLSESSNTGTTWTTPTITGISGPPYGWDQNGNLDVVRRVVVADRVNANTFYAYNDGSACGGSASTAGVYKGQWSGSAWTWGAASSGTIDSNGCFWATLKSVTSTGGEMLYTSGTTGPGPYPHTLSLWDCTDSTPSTAAGTVTCSAFTNIKEAWAVGIGAAKPGGSGVSTIYIAGWANCGQSGINGCGAASGYTWGVWCSASHGTSWYYLGTPLNSLDQIVDVEGDGNTYGTAYVVFHSSGFAFITGASC